MITSSKSFQEEDDEEEEEDFVVKKEPSAHPNGIHFYHCIANNTLILSLLHM